MSQDAPKSVPPTQLKKSSQNDPGLGESDVASQPMSEAPEAPPPKVLRRIQEVVGMMQISGGFDPLAAKMSPEHITAVIENKDRDSSRKHTEELKKYDNQRWFFVGSIVAILSLCLIFLWFGKTEHLDAVLAAVAGLAGGFGLGKASRDERHSA